MKCIQRKGTLSQSHRVLGSCLLATCLFGLGGTLSAANAQKCGVVDGVSCCAEIFVSDSGNCCSAYACADGSMGGSCSVCSVAATVDSENHDSDVAVLAGVEHIAVNDTVLELQLT